MHNVVNASHWRADDFQAVDLQYEGGDLSMLVLLPSRKHGLADLEGRLSASILRECVARMERRAVDVFLPRFTIATESIDLRVPLTALGMALPFDRARADFSGINGFLSPHDDALWVAAVFHKAFAEVNEEGTEAAAATAITMRATAAPGGRAGRSPVPIFRADHPFLFAIRDGRSESLLFLGRVVDPSRGG
jgi:serpin B